MKKCKTLDTKPNVTEVIWLCALKGGLNALELKITNWDIPKDTLCKNYMFKLQSFRLEQIGQKVTITFMGFIDSELIDSLRKFKAERIIFGVTDDPRTVSALDWADMGAYQLRYKLYEPKVLCREGKLVIEVKAVDCVREMTCPDRVRWF